MLGGDDVRIIYRHYATLYFVFVVEESESELGILDLIQVQSYLPSRLSLVRLINEVGIRGESRSLVSESLRAGFGIYSRDCAD